MDIVENARAADVDPLSAFPSESELERRTSHRTNQIALDGTSSEIVTALFSALYDLQIDIQSLKAELSATTTAMSGVANRLSSLEDRPIIRAAPLANATRPHLIFARATLTNLYEEIRSQSWRWLHRSCKWSAAPGRRLLTATSRMISGGSARRLSKPPKLPGS